MNKREFLATASATALAALSGAVHAADLRQTSIIVPYTPGGLSDVLLRALAPIAAKHLGRNIIIENKPGNAGLLGPVQMARTAKPDGSVVSFLGIGAYREPFFRKVDWDPIKDFDYVIGLWGFVFGIVVPVDSPFQTLKDIVEFGRKNPGDFTFGSSGNLSSPHLLMENLGLMTGAKFNHIPFKGTSEAIQATIGKHVMATIESPAWAPAVDGGLLRVVATFTEQRTRWNAPTAREAGYDLVFTSPAGLVAPKGLPPPTLKALHDALRAALDDPAFQQTLVKYDMVYWYRSSADYLAWAEQTLVREKDLLTRLNLVRS